MKCCLRVASFSADPISLKAVPRGDILVSFHRCDCVSLHCAGNLVPKQRGGAGMTTGMHVDPAMVDQLADDDEEDEGDIPAGAVRFSVEPEEIAQVLAAEGTEVRNPVLLQVQD